MLAIAFAITAVSLGGDLASLAAYEAVPDTPFEQEYREAFRVHPALAAANDVRGIAVDRAGHAYAATRAGVFRVDAQEWHPLLPRADQGPAFCAETSPDGRVFVGAWNGLWMIGDANGPATQIAAIGDPIAAIGFDASGTAIAVGPRGLYRERDAWARVEGTWATSPRAVAVDSDDAVWIASGHGLWHIAPDGSARSFVEESEISSGELYAVSIDSSARVWVGGTNGLDQFASEGRLQSLQPANGLVHRNIRSLDIGPDGRLWIGTSIGVQRYDGSTWSLRHSQRWLPSDEVRAVAFAADGSAFVATSAGVAVLRTTTMTLADKAAYFYDIVLDRKTRPPGFVEKSRLLTPGDVSTWRTEDDDNDGSYTQLYGLMESFRFHVTGDPAAREAAQRVFAISERLQTVTGTSGFVARTMIPMWWNSPANDNPNRIHDRNRSYGPMEVAAELVKDPRYKPVEVRWRPASDGYWLWKGDTSSDEITGHFYGWYHYYALIAETDAERTRVADLVRRVMDYIIDGGLTLIDPIDGTHTRWAVWSPEKLLGDPNWRAERPVNATEILAFLNVTFGITGDEKYRDLALALIEEHGYAEFARSPKPTNPSERTYIDSSLLAQVLPGLIRTEPDPELQAVFAEGLRQWYGEIEQDKTPHYSLTCASLGIEGVDIEACVAFLRDAPLDNVRWTVDQRKRRDLAIVNRPEPTEEQVDRMLPPSENAILRWDKNPYRAINGDGGRTEGSTIYWLLPYWMGRYYGFIAAPA